MSNKPKGILDNISERDYKTLIDEWKIISQPIDIFSVIPSILEVLQNNASKKLFFKNKKDITDEMEGIKFAALCDITKSIYRGLATTRSVMRDVCKGQSTYAELSAYIASFFFTKAITLILGVWISPEAISISNNRKKYMLDFFCNYKKDYRLVLYDLQNKPFGHTNFWYLFKKLLDVTNNKTNCLSDLCNLKIKYSDIPLLRNKIQYSYSFWGENDLLQDNSKETEWLNQLKSEEKIECINFEPIDQQPNKLFLLKLLDCAIQIYGDIGKQTALDKHYLHFHKEKEHILTKFNEHLETIS